jgi:hypothetical protein
MQVSLAAGLDVLRENSPGGKRLPELAESDALDVADHRRADAHGERHLGVAHVVVFSAHAGTPRSWWPG